MKIFTKSEIMFWYKSLQLVLTIDNINSKSTTTYKLKIRPSKEKKQEERKNYFED